MRADPRERPGPEASLEVRKAFSQYQLDILIAVLVDQVENALDFRDVGHRSNFLKSLEQSLQASAAAQNLKMKGRPFGKEIKRHISSVVRSQRYSPLPIRCVG